MSAARTGHHRRTTPAVAPAVAELRRIRAELDRVTAERDEARALAVDLAGGDGHAWCNAAREREAADQFAAGAEYGAKREAAERDRAWHDAADPIAHPGPSLSRLEFLRWGPPVENCPRHGDDCTGRLHFADPRPGDYTGGPVVWPELPAADVPAVA